MAEIMDSSEMREKIEAIEKDIRERRSVDLVIKVKKAKKAGLMPVLVYAVARQIAYINEPDTDDNSLHHVIEAWSSLSERNWWRIMNVLLENATELELQKNGKLDNEFVSELFAGPGAIEPHD